MNRGRTCAPHSSRGVTHAATCERAVYKENKETMEAEIKRSELSREEQLELDLAAERLTTAELAQAAANRAVADTRRVLEDTKARLIQSALQRRAAAAVVPATPPANRAERRRTHAKSAKKS